MSHVRRSQEILEMLTEGKMTADDAARLLGRIGSGGGEGRDDAGEESSASDQRGRSLRCLRVVDSDDRDKASSFANVAAADAGIASAAPYARVGGG